MMIVAIPITDSLQCIKFLSRAALCAGLLLLAACDTDSSFDGGGEFTGQSADAAISGFYKLITVNDAPVPGKVQHRFAQMVMHGGDFTIRNDGTCSSRIIFSPPVGGKEVRVSHCEYQRDEDELTMQWLGAAETSGKIVGDKLVMDNHGMEFEFQRVQPIGALATLDLSDECDPAVLAAAPTSSQAGTVDDFSDDLVSGLNRQGLSIGFLTFQDSPTTKIAMSTTGKHPPRAGESSGNSVLKLEMDVRQWAGVIHAFENDTVTRWSPQNWRGLSELSFWFYGNNRQTTLFVEVLDNRKPCPNASGAEVFTYQFVDDFKGWQQIVVPFAAFQRKEIYNNAPADGLGLRAVHGWAIGSLDTGGRTTYYVDDIEVR